MIFCVIYDKNGRDRNKSCTLIMKRMGAHKFIYKVIKTEE